MAAQQQAEAALRRAGALAALDAASVLVHFPAVDERRWHVVVALASYAIFLLGCTAVVLSPPGHHRARAELAWRAAEGAVREICSAAVRAASGRRWAGFACVVFYAVYVIADVPVVEPASSEDEEVSSAAAKVSRFLLFLVFLAAVWTVILSVIAATTDARPLPAPPECSTPEWERPTDWLREPHVSLTQSD